MNHFTDWECLRLQNVKSQVTEAQKIASGSGSEQDIAEAKIELEVSRTPYGPSHLETN